MGLRKLHFRLRSQKKWRAVSTYAALHRMLSSYGLPDTPAAVVSGPLRRFFELAMQPGQSAGQRCRIIEHARHWSAVAGDGYLAKSDAASFKEALEAEITRLSALGENGRWVARVFVTEAFHHAAPPFPGEPEV